MKQIKLFIELTRLKKPIGFMLLFWPCAWGLALAHDQYKDLEKFLIYGLLFFLGSILMRSAGCIFNDIVDKDIDKKVARTKKRPLASGAITVKQSFFYIIILCLIAFFILIQFNRLTIILGLASMFLAFAYPFMKRITYWPQLFLGLTFNWGAVMAWTSINNGITPDILILYLAAIFWTLGYDTIYGLQDVIDDEIIGMKSTAIKFKNSSKQFVSFCYFINIYLLFYLFKDYLNNNYFIIFMTIYLISLIYQIISFNKKKPITCLKSFKMNNFSGLILFLLIFNISLG